MILKLISEMRPRGYFGTIINTALYCLINSRYVINGPYGIARWELHIRKLNSYLHKN
jgi:hypothetical protein